MKRIIWKLAAGTALLATAACNKAPAEQDAAAAAAEASPSAQVAADEPAARAFVDKLYAAYANDAEPSIFARPEDSFEPELAAAIAKLDARTEKTGTIEASQDADPLCNCQDFGDASHSIDTLTLDGSKAKAVVTFTNFGKAEKRTIDLVATPAGWRIQDVDGTYRAAVMRDLAQP